MSARSARGRRGRAAGSSRSLPMLATQPPKVTIMKTWSARGRRGRPVAGNGTGRAVLASLRKIRTGSASVPPKKKVTPIRMNFEDTICIICSKAIKADPVAMVLQNTKENGKMMSVFCEVMETGRPVVFDFSKEPFPFCRPCSFMVEELKEVHDEIQLLQLKMRNIKAKCAAKVLETSAQSYDSNKGKNSNLGKKVEVKKVVSCKNKALAVRRSIARRFKPRVLIQNLKGKADTTSNSLPDIVKCPKCYHPVPVATPTVPKPDRVSGVLPIYEDEEMKLMMRDLLDCLQSSFPHGATEMFENTMNFDDRHLYLDRSLNEALIATRDAWINDYLAQLFALNYNQESLWGSKAFRRVEAELEIVDSTLQNGVELIGHQNLTGNFERPLHYCHHCNEGFKQRVRLKQHLYSAHGEGHFTQFKCNICGKSYSRKPSVNYHLQTAHQVDLSLLPPQYTKEIIRANNPSLSLQPQPSPSATVTLPSTKTPSPPPPLLTPSMRMDETTSNRSSPPQGPPELRMEDESDDINQVSVVQVPDSVQAPEVAQLPRFNPVVMLTRLSTSDILKHIRTE